MKLSIEKALTYASEHHDDFLQTLVEFLKIKTISTDSNHTSEMKQGAEWVAYQLKQLGASESYLIETSYNPIVYGHISSAGPEKPTVLVYGHYDVQPPDPLELWKHEPFNPVIINGCLFARGVSDMKGQLQVIFSAIASIKQTGEYPVNFKFIIEGQEEIGSPGIKDALEKNKGLFQSDFVLNLDAGMISKDKPTIVYGLRGLAYFELSILGPQKDLHSGMFGGVVYNPFQALCEIISDMKNQDGVIQLPGFYDDVIPLSEGERASLKELGMDDDFFLNQTGVSKLWGEKGYTPVERVGSRPTLEIHGFMGGYSGEGPKTVIPSQAVAKISMRLVPNQTPDKVHEQLIAFLEERVPEHVKWELEKFSSEPASLSDIHFYATQCFADSLQQVWGKPPVYERGGGSIPIVGHIQNTLKLESVLSGFSLPEDNIHSPNEKMDLEVFSKGIKTVIYFFFNLSEKCEQ